MDKLKLRQICFLFAAVLPVTKLIIYPSTLSYYAKNDLLLSAAVSFLAEGVVVAAVMLLAGILVQSSMTRARFSRVSVGV